MSADLNDGSGLFAKQVIPIGSTSPNLPARAIVLGDVDGDGDIDAFLGRFNGGSPLFELALNGGSGTFTTDYRSTFQSLSTSGSTSDDAPSNDNIAFGDIDGDGDLDLMLLCVLHLNDGTGRFVVANPITYSLSNFFCLTSTFGDVDGDSDLDLVATSGGGYHSSAIELHTNDATGSFMYVSSSGINPIPGMDPRVRSSASECACTWMSVSCWRSVLTHARSCHWSVAAELLPSRAASSPSVPSSASNRIPTLRSSTHADHSWRHRQ